MNIGVKYNNITFTKDNYFHALTVSFSKNLLKFLDFGGIFFWDNRYVHKICHIFEQDMHEIGLGSLLIPKSTIIQRE